MADTEPTAANVLAALPGVRKVVAAEIARRMAAGQQIVSDRTPEIASDIARRGAELDAQELGHCPR